MNRRDVLKGLGLSLGYVIATPTIFGILQSCKNEIQMEWNPQFFIKNESVILKNLVNLILPKTNNLPGAIEVNIPQFIDSYLDKVISVEQQSFYKNGMISIQNLLGKSVNKLTNKDYDTLIARFLKANIDEVEQFLNNKDDVLIYETLTSLRTLTIWAYKNSQKIGEEYLAYDPIPGKLQGCISLEEATGGKAWSL